MVVKNHKETSSFQKTIKKKKPVSGFFYVTATSRVKTA